MQERVGGRSFSCFNIVATYSTSLTCNSRPKGASTINLTFLTLQGHMAVSIDTCNALARFISLGYPWTGLCTGGFWETLTPTCRNPYPWMQVWAFTGTGTGSSGIPQGYPWQSLAYRLSWSLWLGYTTSAGDLQVLTGYLRLPARDYLQITHLWIQINLFPRVLPDLGRHTRILQIPAGYLPGQINEVFTLPPYFTWIPCGIHVVPHGICPFHMEYVLAEISPIFVISFHLYSMWIPPFHMEFPLGIHMECSTWIPSHFHVDSMWIPPGIPNNQY